MGALLRDRHFSDRGGQVRYAVSEIGEERRTGYLWSTDEPANWSDGNDVANPRVDMQCERPGRFPGLFVYFGIRDILKSIIYDVNPFKI